MRYRIHRAALPLLIAAGHAQAHDTWFAPLPSPRPAEVRLALGTGERFPQQQTSVGDGALVAHGCRRGTGAAAALRIERDTAGALLLHARPGGRGSLTCWAQLVPLQIEIPPDKVRLYLDEIAAPPAVRDAWREMHARGVAWRETYVKHARFERAEGDATPGPAAAAGIGLDIVLESGLAPLRAGDTIALRVLRDGQPLAGQAIELRGDLGPRGVWLKTDAEGRARVRVPLAGHWLLRGTDLRLSTRTPDTWESRFVTLAFEVGAAAD